MEKKDSTGSDQVDNQRKGVKRHRNDKTRLNPVFCEPSVRGIEACPDPEEVSRIQSLVQSIIGWKG